MFAVLETGGKQHKVQPGSVLRVEKLEIPQGEQVTFDRILAVGDEEQTIIGTPLVEGARVLAQVLQQGKAHKIIVFKYKAKKNYRRKKGHRQLFTEIRVREIICPGFTSGQADTDAGAGEPALKAQQPPEQENEQPDNDKQVKKSARKATAAKTAPAKTTTESNIEDKAKSSSRKKSASTSKAAEKNSKTKAEQ